MTETPEALRAKILELETDNRRLSREVAMCRLDVGPSPYHASTEPDKPKKSYADRVMEALTVAHREWNHPVQEPPGVGWQMIDMYIRESLGLGWTWEKEYTENGQFAWCGAFMAYCWGSAGLKADLRKSVCPSTYRLHRWVKAHKDRLVSVEEQSLKAGDVLIVGREGSKYGDHITLVREDVVGVPGFAKILTYEGNARGVGPDGSRYEGVVMMERPFSASRSREYRALWALRWSEEDFE